MLHRKLFTVMIGALIALTSPALVLADERAEDAHWTVNIHTGPKGTLSAVGTLHLGSGAAGDRQAWRVVGVEQPAGASPLEFLQLLGTPVGPARSSTPVALEVRIDYGEDRTPDAAGRVKVKFTWTVDGVPVPAKDGTILIKGKTITVKNQSVLQSSTGDEG